MLETALDRFTFRNISTTADYLEQMITTTTDSVKVDPIKLDIPQGFFSLNNLVLVFIGLINSILIWSAFYNNQNVL